MSRTTARLVEGILGRNYDGKTSLTPFIDTATELVNRAVLIGNGDGISLSNETQELLERWLAAHFYTRMDPAYSSQGIGASSGNFQGKTDEGLRASFYGQTALDLDTYGLLEKATAKKATTIKAAWLGIENRTRRRY